MKKTLALVAVVIGVHCAVIMALILTQGCKTTSKATSASSSATPMPPISAPSPAVTIEKIEPFVAPKEITEETIEYTVKSGDSLGLIAKKHNASKSELMEFNKLADPNKIRIGQKLLIPKRAHAVPPAPKKAAQAKPEAKAKKSEPAPTPSLATAMNEYVVQPGDHLSKIAAKLGVKISALWEVNKLANDKLKIGQKLIIPSAKKAEGAPVPAVAGQLPAAPAEPAAVSPGATPKNSAAGMPPHVVLSGEDLAAIAKLYAVKVDDIVAANQLGTNRTVQVGQKLIIP